MPQFIPGYSDQQMPAPYKFTGVTLWSFPLVASYNALKSSVDKYLNVAPPGGVDFEFRPLGARLTGRAIVYMMVLHYDRMVSASPPFDTMGYLVQNEFYFAIPVVRLQGLLPVDVGLFTPYIFVDNPWSMVCGNTVIGYPKQMAWFSMPQQGPDNPYPIMIDAPVFTQYSPDTPLTWQRVVEVNSVLGQLGDRIASLWPFGNIEALFGPNGQFPIEKGVFSLLQKIVGDNAYSLVQLKQILDVAKPDTACYQAIVNLTVGLDSLPSSGPLPPAVIDLHAYASLPIGEDLGLSYVNGRLFPITPYWARCDFSVKDPKVLYSAT